MKVLIIEDDKNKILQVKTNMQDRFSEVIIEQKFSFQSGLKAILKNDNDLILLDMSMPNFDITQTDDGGRPRPFAGRDLLRQMKRRNICVPVIIITQFEKFGDVSNRTSVEELTDQLEQKYSDNFQGMIHYNPAEKKWVDELTELIEKIRSANNA